MSITINGIDTAVKPIINSIKRIKKGTIHEMQDGTENNNIIKTIFEIELFYSSLTYAEFIQLEPLIHVEGYSSDVYVTVVLNEKTFDGATLNVVLNRILNKMIIKEAEEILETPYENSGGYRSLKLVLRES